MRESEVQLVVIKAIRFALRFRAGAVDQPFRLSPILARNLRVVRHLGKIEIIRRSDHCPQTQVVARVAGIEAVVSTGGFATGFGLSASILLLIFEHANH